MIRKFTLEQAMEFNETYFAIVRFSTLAQWDRRPLDLIQTSSHHKHEDLFPTGPVHLDPCQRRTPKTKSQKGLKQGRRRSILLQIRNLWRNAKFFQKTRK